VQWNRTNVELWEFLKYEGAHANLVHIKKCVESELSLEDLAAWYNISEKNMQKFLEDYL
jgi:hypothetical protein